jgi:excisionase family DNA binding protein
MDRNESMTMTVAQAGSLLGISRRSAYRAAAAGHIPTIRLGRRLLVPIPKLHAMLGISVGRTEAQPAALSLYRRITPTSE